MTRFRQGPAPALDEALTLKESLRELMNHRPTWPPSKALLPFARHSLRIPPDRENDWYLRAWWGWYATRILGKYIRTGAVDEALGLLEPVDWTPLERALESGKGVVLATNHLGPCIAVAHIAVKRAGYPSLVLSANADAEEDGDISVHSVANRKQSLAKALLHLRRNKIVVAAADGRHGDKFVITNFLNQRIKIFTGIGELVRLSGAASCWLSASWTGTDRIRLGIAPMENPAAEGDEWLRQWYRAYLIRLARQMRNSPADLGFRGGLLSADAGGLRLRPAQRRQPSPA
jgi:hypothetical protein